MRETPVNPTHEVMRRRLFEEDPESRAAYEEMEPAYLVAREILRARGELGISQAELARRVGTSQSVISRLENMETTPNLRTVMGLARALGRRVELHFVDPAVGGFDTGELPEWMFGDPEDFAAGLTQEVSRHVGDLTDLVRKAQRMTADRRGDDHPDHVEPAAQEPEPEPAEAQG